MRRLGLSATGVNTIRRAHAVLPVGDLHIACSLISRGIEDSIVSACREPGIGTTAYGVLARGLISGHWSKERSAAGHNFRTHSPRFQGANLEQTPALVELLRELAETRAVSAAQLAIAWVLARREDSLPLLGARTPVRD